MARRYTPDTIVIAAAGNLNHDEIVEMVRARFGHLTGNKADWRMPDAEPQPIAATAYIEKPIEQVNLVLGTNGYSQLADEKYTLSILDNVLGGSMSSRLFQEIRRSAAWPTRSAPTRSTSGRAATSPSMPAPARTRRSR